MIVFINDSEKHDNDVGLNDDVDSGSRGGDDDIGVPDDVEVYDVVCVGSGCNNDDDVNNDENDNTRTYHMSRLCISTMRDISSSLMNHISVHL